MEICFGLVFRFTLGNISHPNPFFKQVRGYRSVKQGLRRRLEDMEHEKRRAQSVQPFISTSGNISASILLRFIFIVLIVMKKNCHC